MTQELPIHDTSTFPARPNLESGETMHTYNLVDLAPAPSDAARPAVQRLGAHSGATIIAMTFTPGQVLADHKAAHPILVQAVAGELQFSCGDETVTLTPGMVLHLDPMVVHRVSVAADAKENGVLFLTMLTPRRD
ncbi:cupin domain-containing protein [Corynebacterium choanae]|uniref:AraC-type arabinose-binding/dimerisation domain-containing protein n=1 Tax=Corynebacterium choanae TaxID=1862358 RepID=A0A3G6J6X7_9CORY|nr:cupin domain-containing protein [Corynebacterium choanae]AZA13865.1 hypothetical protein CCHOA_07365 [Corynebacterium choanae]